MTSPTCQEPHDRRHRTGHHFRRRGLVRLGLAHMTQCVDCTAEGITTPRPIVSGIRKPRCATHTRAAKKRAKMQTHATRTQRTYGITGDDYWKLYAAQDERCAICRVARGVTKRLAVDHDHTTGEVRGLLCGPCNQLIGRLGTEALLRAARYLEDPPARRVLNG